MITFTFSISNLKHECSELGCRQSAIVLHRENDDIPKYYCQKHAPSLEDAVLKSGAARTKSDAAQS